MCKLLNIHNTIIESACVSKYVHINVSLHEPYLLDFFPHFFSMHIYVLTYNRGVFCKVDLRFHAACHINGSSLGGRHHAVWWFRKSKRNYLKWGSVSMLIPIFFLHLFEEHGPWPFLGGRNLPWKKTTFLMEFNGRSLRMAVVKRWWIINHHGSFEDPWHIDLRWSPKNQPFMDR